MAFDCNVRKWGRMKIYALLTLAVLMTGGTRTASAQTQADQKAVIDTLELMAKATVARDAATLEKVYGDDVTYSHSSGATQTKAEVLAGIRGNTVNVFMKFSEMTVRIYG